MEGNSLKSFENLCKIFETRIKLDKEKNIDTPDDVLINYEKYAKKIDDIYNKEFEDNIKPLLSPAGNLERERERLDKLIKLLENRLDKREELENRFYLTTGKYFNNLQLVVSETELNDKKDRLKLINKYLDTDKEIKSITESVAKLKNSLDEEEKKKEDYLVKNKIMEEELNNAFLDIIKSDDYFSHCNEDDIDTRLVEVIDKVKETSETLEVTKDSVESLVENGTNDDYTSYIEDAERNYYIWKNREIVLKIYERIVEKVDEFNDIFEKREKIDELVRERSSIRINLNIDDNDEFYSFGKILLEQMDNLDGEREILENIANYTSRIKFKEERLDELEQDINSVEMLALLKEYKLIDTYESEKIEETEEDEDPVLVEKDDSVVIEEINPYRIVEVKDYPKTLNIGLAKLKAESVRDKINKKLNPKEEFDFSPTEDIKPKFELENDKNIENVETETEDAVVENNQEEVKENLNLPTWEVPIDNLPVWEETTTDEKNMNNLPVWDDVSNKEESAKDLPIWGEVMDTSTETTANENMFWTPVDDVPNSENSFVKIPFNSDSSVFDFPNLNN